MTVLVVGGTGATGQQLVKQLLARGHAVKLIVRSPAKLSIGVAQHEEATVIQANLLDLTDVELASHMSGCDAVASCLGHTMSLKGVYGPPYRLVTDATQRLCSAIKADNTSGPVKFVLMNTAGNQNRDLEEHVSVGERIVIGMLRLLVPPHADNEMAAEYLRTQVGQRDRSIEWVVVRPDTLIDHPEVTEYTVHVSPTRSAIFDPGRTSRINVGHFIATLIDDNELWNRWKGQMPVIYNATSP